MGASTWKRRSRERAAERGEKDEEDEEEDFPCSLWILSADCVNTEVTEPEGDVECDSGRG